MASVTASLIRGLRALGGLRGRGRTLAGYAAALILLVAWVKGYVHLEGPDFAASTPSAVTAANGDGGNGGRPAAVYAPHLPLPSARPVRVGIPSVGIDAPVVVRGLTTDGAVEPPPYDTPDVMRLVRQPAPRPAPRARPSSSATSTPRPGRPSSTPSARSPPALWSMSPAPTAPSPNSPSRPSRSSTRPAFRPDRVYGSDGRPELRLITCGGVFDRAKQAYSANVVVYAALTGSTTLS